MSEIQEEFKKILEYGIRRGNENSITVQEFVSEMADQLRELMEKMNGLDEVR